MHDDEDEEDFAFVRGAMTGMVISVIFWFLFWLWVIS